MAAGRRRSVPSLLCGGGEKVGLLDVRFNMYFTYNFYMNIAKHIKDLKEFW